MPSVFDWPWRELEPAARAEEAQTLVARLDGEFATGDRALDLGCGSGAFALELAARGAEVTGIDAAAPLLDLARAEAGRRGLDAMWILGDITARELGAADHALALCIGNVILDIPHERFPAFAVAVAGALRPGGLLLIGFQDGVLRCAGMEAGGKKLLQEEPERITRRFLGYEPAAGSWREEYHNLDRDERLVYTAHLYTAPLIAALLSPWFLRESTVRTGERDFLDSFRRLD